MAKEIDVDIDAELAKFPEEEQEEGLTVEPEAPVAPEEPEKETPVVPEPVVPEPVFKTKEEADEYINTKIMEALNAAKPAELVKEEAGGAYFKEGYIPKDLNQLANDLLPIAAQKVREDIRAEEQARIDEQQKINTLFDKQADDLVKAGKLPSIETEEGKKALGNMLKYGAQYGARDVNVAYEMWSKVPEEFGGGYKVSVAKEKAAAQRKVAGMIGGLKGGEGISVPKTNYDKRVRTDMDSLVQEALDKS